jgi:hypothetical protein
VEPPLVEPPLATFVSRCTNLTGNWTDGGPHPTSNTRIAQNGSIVHSFGSYGDGIGTLEGSVISSMSFSSAAEGSHGVPSTQSAIITQDCANFWFCGTVQANPTLASCSNGAHWVRGSTSTLPPAPPPPGPPPPPPPPGNAVREFNQFATASCEGTTMTPHGTWRYGECLTLYPSLVPPNVTSSVGSTLATLGAASHTIVAFGLFSDTNCSTPLSSWKSTVTVPLNTCTESSEPQGTFSLFQGHDLPF